MGEEYITICVACTKGVTRNNMQYVNGMAFHPECYQKHGKDYRAVDDEVAKNAARLKVDLVQLKNLKIRKKSGPKPKKVEKKAKKGRSKKRTKPKAMKIKRKTSKKSRKVATKRTKKRR